MVNAIHKALPKYLLAAILIIVPLFPKFPLFPVPGTYVAIRFEDLLLLLLGILTLFKIAKNFKNFIHDDVTKVFILFFGIALISLLSGIFLTKTVVLHIGLLNFFRRVEYLIPFFAVLVLFNGEEAKRNLEFYLKILIVVVIVAFFYGLGQRYLAFPIITTQNTEYAKGVALRYTPGSHISSTFAGHYDLAAFMVIILPIFIVLLTKIEGKWSKLIIFLTISGGLWLLINSLARISQVSYLASVTIALLIVKKYKILGAVLLISLLLIGSSSGLKDRFGRVIKVYLDKLTYITNISVKAASPLALPKLRENLTSPSPSPVPVFEDRSTSIRLQVEWPRAIRAFTINPFLGTGYSSISLATDNDFLRMLGETGILGLAAFMLIFVKIARHILISIKEIKTMSAFETALIAGSAGGVIGTFLGAFFIDLFEASKFAILFWFWLGYALAISKTYYDGKKI